MHRKDRLFGGKLAKEYNQFNKAVPHHERFQKMVGEEVAKACARTARERELVIAECGVGTGLTLGNITEQTGGLMGIRELHAVDSSSEMTRIAKEKNRNPKINFVNAEFGEFLDGFSGKIDLVYSAYTIHNLARNRQVALFRKIYQKLDENGWFVDGDILAHPNPLIQKEIFEWQLEMFRKELPPELAKRWIDHYHADSKEYCTLPQIEGILKEMGFVVDIAYREKLEAILVAQKSHMSSKPKVF